MVPWSRTADAHHHARPAHDSRNGSARAATATRAAARPQPSIDDGRGTTACGHGAPCGPAAGIRAASVARGWTAAPSCIEVSMPPFGIAAGGRRSPICTILWITLLHNYPQCTIVDICGFVHIFVDNPVVCPPVIPTLSPSYPHPFPQMWKTTSMSFHIPPSVPSTSPTSTPDAAERHPHNSPHVTAPPRRTPRSLRPWRRRSTVTPVHSHTGPPSHQPTVAPAHRRISPQSHRPTVAQRGVVTRRPAGTARRPAIGRPTASRTSRQRPRTIVTGAGAPLPPAARRRQPPPKRPRPRTPGPRPSQREKRSSAT